MKKSIYIISLLCGVVLITSSAYAKSKEPAVVVELTEQGKKLEATYAGWLESLKAGIEKELPASAELPKPTKVAMVGPNRYAGVVVAASLEFHSSRCGCATRLPSSPVCYTVFDIHYSALVS